LSEQAPQTIEELKALLDELGIEPGKWDEKEARRVMPAMVGDQREKLLHLRDLFQGLVEQDEKSLVALKEQLARLKFGGGI